MGHENYSFAFALMFASVAACAPDAPKVCGKGIESVQSVSFVGPSEIWDAETVTYYATMKVTPSKNAALVFGCFVVFDDDPWTKFLWAIDDNIDAGVATGASELQGEFSLKCHNGKVMGSGSLEDLRDAAEALGSELPPVQEYTASSGEDEAEIYIRPFFSEGGLLDKSQTQSVRCGTTSSPPSCSRHTCPPHGHLSCCPGYWCDKEASRCRPNSGPGSRQP